MSPSQRATSSRKTSPSAKRPRRGERKWNAADADSRKDMIVDAALTLLNRRGPTAVTMRAVAHRLGIGAMTLYTYVDGQPGLRRAMIARGFAMLHAGCEQTSTLDSEGSWRGGARAYIRFAHEHPNLYRMMFADPLPDNVDQQAREQSVLMGGFEPLLQRVKERLETSGLSGAALHRSALRAAGRFWIALHGLATLSISNRLTILEADVDELLDDLLQHVAPR